MRLNQEDIRKQQLQECKKFDTTPVLLDDNQLVVVSEGVLAGDPVEGVRYPSPKHMSGWWITTDKYNGDISTLTTEHAYHILERRPDLAKYMLLPYGFRFRVGTKEDVWFDEKVAKEIS